MGAKDAEQIELERKGTSGAINISEQSGKCQIQDQMDQLVMSTPSRLGCPMHDWCGGSKVHLSEMKMEPQVSISTSQPTAMGSR